MAKYSTSTTRKKRQTYSPYRRLTRRQWAKLRASTPLTLTSDELEELRGLSTFVSMDEVVSIYLPLSRLLGLYVIAQQQLYQATDRFLGHNPPKVPYVIGIAGSVAVGKSTTARILQTLLSRWPDHPKVSLITTDGFLYPNRVLKKKGIMHRKGFPESYNQKRLLDFVRSIKSGRFPVHAPVYSHLIYDILPNEYQTVDQSDIMIIEGLNILQRGNRQGPSDLFVSDFFDFSIYVDATEPNLEAWYIQRFMRLRETAFRRKSSYFQSYANLSEAEARRTACQIWRSINAINLKKNIQPTRERARLILKKGDNHLVEQIQLRKL
ncbi:type I pantothenate kinase [Anaerolineales bacterium HSG6]|nr:type I pantothenate kinase [Anaerolineales bacterium HSG6]